MGESNWLVRSMESNWLVRSINQIDKLYN